MASIVKSTVIYTIGNIIPKAASFVLLPIYATYLTPSDYGIISAVQAIGPILLILFSFSFCAAIFRLYYDYPTDEDKKAFFSTVFISTFAISTLSLLLIFLFSDYVGKIYSSISFYPFFFYVIITSYITNLFDVPQKYLMLNNRPITYVMLSLLRFILNTGLILWYIILEKEGAPGYLKAGLLTSIAILPIYLILTSKIINFKFSFSIFKSILAYSLPLIPTLISAWVLDLSDRIFLERYSSLDELGIYSLAYTIAGVVLLVVSSFDMAYRPFFFKYANYKDSEQGEKIIYKYNFIFLLLSIFLAFVISFLSKEVVVILFNVQYHEVYLYVPIIVISYIFSVAGGLVARFFEQSKKMKINMFIYLGISVINLFLNYFLIPIIGAYGAAIATVISLFMGFIIGYLYAKRKCYFVAFNWSQLWPIALLLLFIFIMFNSWIAFENIYYSLASKSIIVFLLSIYILKKYIKDYSLLLIK